VQAKYSTVFSLAGAVDMAANLIPDPCKEVDASAGNAVLKPVVATTALGYALVNPLTSSAFFWTTDAADCSLTVFARFVTPL
jgi:hypothetical protein